MLRTGSPHKRLRILPLAAVIFLTVSGGPYGLEPLLSYAGTHGALLILMLTPLLWDVPTIFVVMELNSMMPVTGGYYQWVKRALGIRWAWYEGWWTWLYTFVDLAIYPVLFVEYASFFFPGDRAIQDPDLSCYHLDGSGFEYFRDRSCWKDLNDTEYYCCTALSYSLCH